MGIFPECLLNDDDTVHENMLIIIYHIGVYQLS